MDCWYFQMNQNGRNRVLVSRKPLLYLQDPLHTILPLLLRCPRPSFSFLLLQFSSSRLILIPDPGSSNKARLKPKLALTGICQSCRMRIPTRNVTPPTGKLNRRYWTLESATTQFRVKVNDAAQTQINAG